MTPHLAGLTNQLTPTNLAGFIAGLGILIIESKKEKRPPVTRSAFSFWKGEKALSPATHRHWLVLPLASSFPLPSAAYAAHSTVFATSSAAIAANSAESPANPARFTATSSLLHLIPIQSHPSRGAEFAATPAESAAPSARYVSARSQSTCPSHLAGLLLQATENKSPPILPTPPSPSTVPNRECRPPTPPLRPRQASSHSRRSCPRSAAARCRSDSSPCGSCPCPASSPSGSARRSASPPSALRRG